MKYLIPLITVILFLSSCDKPVYYNIPKDEKPLLKDKDTVVFMERETKELDSFLIKRTDDYIVSDKRYYQEEIIVKYYKLNKSASINEFGYGLTQSTNISFESFYFPSIYSSQESIDIH